MVREAGLEPARPYWTLEPESSESANSTTRASIATFSIASFIIPYGFFSVKMISYSQKQEIAAFNGENECYFLIILSRKSGLPHPPVRAQYNHDH